MAPSTKHNSFYFRKDNFILCPRSHEIIQTFMRSSTIESNSPIVTNSTTLFTWNYLFHWPRRLYYGSQILHALWPSSMLLRTHQMDGKIHANITQSRNYLIYSHLFSLTSFISLPRSLIPPMRDSILVRL